MTSYLKILKSCVALSFENLCTREQVQKGLNLASFIQRQSNFLFTLCTDTKRLTAEMFAFGKLNKENLSSETRESRQSLVGMLSVKAP